MISSWFESARRSLRRHARSGSRSSRVETLSRSSRFAGRAPGRTWFHQDHNIEEGDGLDAAELPEGRNEVEAFGEGVDAGADGEEDDNDDDDDTETNDEEDVPLLPIFEASYLDSLPVYSLTHAIRLLVTSRCETTLSWDQLRSPQVSQFLVKPMQKEIMENHFSKATAYALIANCLQFNKEADTNPAIVGMSRTRSMVCELLAIRILKEYSTRELIDVLSYDFYPLQGMEESMGTSRIHKRPQAARTSTLEVAIRASTKRFLAHPMVVQQLEAIWAGTIVFHHAADAAHRRPTKASRLRQYGTVQSGTTSGLLSEAARAPLDANEVSNHLATRRTVTLYDPREASLFKLSRLRVPRYRHFLSTCSLAIFLGLFLAVLTTRSANITSLEIVFWLWSAGFMLDEVVGFNEQGFSLYFMSIWNAFDIGILLLLICFYALRLYSVVLLEGHKRHINDLAFDMLAANAVLLFPRLFSILDHYRYFSQLLIAFRMMAQDLAAVFVLITISCSGFFVAFTLSFGSDIQNPGGTAYALFQMLMGFTPTAWTLWDDYNFLGRTLLILFLTITHFLVVTILVTVLTNSFTAIVQNANDEHQFVFAVNTISMVKSDALFSYIAPSNILGWILTPLRYVILFRQFVWLNRTVIKITHFPVLLLIFAYERLILRYLSYEPDETVQQRGRQVRRFKSFDPVGSGMMIFSPREPKLREPSAATFHKDKALAEVFRRPFRDTLRKSEKDRKKRAAVDTWMQDMGPQASPPDEQDREVVDHLERPQLGARQFSGSRRFASGMSIATRSLAASDPEDFTDGNTSFRPVFQQRRSKQMHSMEELVEQSDQYGDDELVSNDDDLEQMTIGEQEMNQDKESTDRTPKQATSVRPRLPVRSFTVGNVPVRSETTQRNGKITFANSSPVRWTPLMRRPPMRHLSTSRRIPTHKRNTSIQTVVFNPADQDDALTSSTGPIPLQMNSNNSSTSPRTAGGIPITGKENRGAEQRFQMSKVMTVPTPLRPVLPSRTAIFSTPDLGRNVSRAKDAQSVFSTSPPPSSLHGAGYRGALHASYPRNTSVGLELASDLGDNKASDGLGGVPASFNTQMDFSNRIRRMRSEERHDDDMRMNRLMLARMGSLEQSFREVLVQVKEMRESDNKRKRPRGSLTTSRRASRIDAITSRVGSVAGSPRSMAKDEWSDDEPSSQKAGNSI